jgi:hypothetical protein
MLVKAARILMVAAVIGGVVLCASAAIGNGGPNQNIVVVSYLANNAPTATTYNIQGDGKNTNVAGLSAYYDGIDNVSSILNANTYNRMPVGDWQLSMLNSTARSVRVNLTGAGLNGVTAPDLFNQGQGPGLPARLIENCTMIPLDITQIVMGQTIQCPGWFAFNTSDPNLSYGLGLNPTNDPMTTNLSIACVSNSATGHCNYWTVDPPAGGPAVGRLLQTVYSKSGKGTTTVLGYFNLTFHFEIDGRQTIK